VMLADRVEAATLEMPNPTRRKIQGVIQETIKLKVEDGQLDESPLTQGDLHKIRDSFDVTLRGLVGHRIPYPQQNGQQERRAPRGPSPGRRGSPVPDELGGDTGVLVRPVTPPSASAPRTARTQAIEPTDFATTTDAANSADAATAAEVAPPGEVVSQADAAASAARSRRDGVSGEGQ
jgi:hypothetical protein